MVDVFTEFERKLQEREIESIPTPGQVVAGMGICPETIKFKGNALATLHFGKE